MFKNVGTMPLDDYRTLSTRILTPLARKLPNLNPDIVTWFGLLSAVIVGYFFFRSGVTDLLLASLFIIISGFFDAFDGVLARLHKKSSKRGDFLDHEYDSSEGGGVRDTERSGAGQFEAEEYGQFPLTPDVTFES